MATITADDLRRKGISHIKRFLNDDHEAVISVRGQPRFVVMDLARYNFLRECEIAVAWAQAREDVEAGRCRRERTDEHLVRIEEQLIDTK